MSVARLLYRGYSGDPVIYSDTAQFGELLMTKQQLAYSGASTAIDFSLTAGVGGGYVPATLRGVDSQFAAGGVFQGRLSFCPKWGTGANRELAWCGMSESNRANQQWGLFVRCSSINVGPTAQPAKIGLTQQTDPTDPFFPINTGMTYLWELGAQSGLDDFLHQVAIDSRGAGTTVALRDIGPLDAAPSTNYETVDNTFVSWTKNAGVATVPSGQATVQVPVPYIDANSIILLTPRFDVASTLVGAVWPTVPVAGTLQINFNAAWGGGDAEVAYFVVQY